MQTESLRIYRCKQCPATFRRRDELQPHLHWHHITDRSVDLYFIDENESLDTAAALGVTRPDRPPRKSEPSFAVLGVCIAILAVLGVAYYVAN
jgi:hypothetical protein